MNRLEKDLESLGIPPIEAVPSAKISPQLTVVARPPHAHWERCRGWIAEGLAGSLLKIEDVEAALARGEAVLWPGERCALVSEFVSYPSGERASQVMSAGGDLGEILAMVPGMEAFARLNGCAISIVEGRRGWERVLKPAGYEFLSIKLRKTL
ncbi:MAG TPA: hypothetical protein VHZ26_15040 [Caulobacteraceae bacterium]|jgi:hypothetical protein|nr:hypothetical protein [Caulobacteraceae bacterium]